ncbi:Guanylate cyclase soluble subunit alpha-2 [Nymphon striatum]|nr:Guanylate cyclase soluble subunit alpha-2 [Nymphon striatum]
MVDGPLTLFDIKVIDGAAIVHMLSVNAVETFIGYANIVFHPHLVRQLENSERVTAIRECILALRANTHFSKEKSGFDYKDNPVISSTKYGDNVTTKLFNATCNVLDEIDEDVDKANSQLIQIMKNAVEKANPHGITTDYFQDILGESFMSYIQNSGYDKLLKCLGGTFPDALINFDTMVDHLESHYAGLRHPTLYAELLDETSMRIVYFTSRPGYEVLMMSVLRAYAKSIFNLNIVIKVEPVKDACKNTIFKVQCAEDEKKTLSSIHTVCSRSRMSRNPKKLQISPILFRKMYPFHVIMKSNDFEIIQLGKSLNKVLLSHLKRLPHKVSFYDLFTVIKPESINSKCYDVQLNRTYVVETNFPVYSGRSDFVFQQSLQGNLRLKGQMIEVDSKTTMMVATPQIHTFEEMKNFGLLYSDFSLHDNIRNIMFMNFTKSDGKDIFKKLEEGSNNLKSLESQLRIDKIRTENVLHALLPAKIAQRLCMNLPVEAEVHSEVSCLFTDIVGFTEICGRPTTHPMYIVRTLNALYSDYDEVLNDCGLYKVETIGDAYIAVCGLQSQVPDHADRTVLMGLKLIEKTKIVSMKLKEFDIKIRVGIHSGSVVAGVVGVKMPRYCLFGHTVTLANQVESWGQPSKVNISYITRRYIKNKQQFTFVCRGETRGTLCYFVDLNEKTSQQRSPQTITPDTASSSARALSELTDDDLDMQSPLANKDVDCCLLEEILSLSMSSPMAKSLFRSRQKTPR